MPPELPEPLAGFPVRVDIPVAWGEMDAFGHVNNVVYFRYFESARIDSYDYSKQCKAPLPAELRTRLARLAASG